MMALLRVMQQRRDTNQGPASVPRDAASDAALPTALAPYEALLRRLEGGGQVTHEHSALIDDALAVWARPGFDSFMCLPRLRFDPFAHQLDAAARVLRHMQGRAILADEVGLGKTIEAGLILSELRLRGLAARVLVLVPAGLVGQWREELERKFALPSAVATAQSFGVLANDHVPPVMIASLPTARRAPLRDLIADASWDLVIADEAHRLRNPRSASGRLVRSLRTRYLLLLSATPVENRLADLFELVSLVRPGLLGSAQQFRARHGARGDGQAARNISELRLVMRDVMVRHRRSEVRAMLPRRLAETLHVTPTDDELALYQAVSQRVRDEARSAGPARLLALRSAQRLAGSSPHALAPALVKLGWSDLADRAGGARTSAKAAALVDVLRHHLARGEKVIVFTAFRRTLDALAEVLAAHAITPAVYHGGLSRTAKDAVIADFAHDAPVLLSTEAAGEGRNLQFCHVMVNFDLPWNPMQIEQRLGRIHRIGQTHDVMLTNLATRGTIEDRLLEVLQSKLNLFELVVGELDMVLGRIHDELDFEARVFGEYVASGDDDEFDERLSAIGEELAVARVAHLDSRARNDDLADAA